MRAYGHMFSARNVLPRLRQLGASGGDIRRITADNTRRFFAGG